MTCWRGPEAGLVVSVLRSHERNLASLRDVRLGEERALRDAGHALALFDGLLPNDLSDIHWPGRPTRTHEGSEGLKFYHTPLPSK